jgi:hypothetical protein
MTFLVCVRWRPKLNEPVCSAQWIVESVRGDCYTLILDDVAGIQHSIPLTLIETVQIERKG